MMQYNLLSVQFSSLHSNSTVPIVQPSMRHIVLAQLVWPAQNPDCKFVLCRFRVVYRLANQVYVMGVAPAHGNVLFAARVVNAATHHLVAVNRGIGVTPDRVANRFPEVRLPSWLASQAHVYIACM